MEEQSNEALWYVVHTYSGYENKVATDLQTMVENRRLQDLICDIKVPPRWSLRSRTARSVWWSTSCSPVTFWSRWS